MPDNLAAGAAVGETKDSSKWPVARTCVKLRNMACIQLSKKEAAAVVMNKLNQLTNQLKEQHKHLLVCFIVGIHHTDFSSLQAGKSTRPLNTSFPMSKLDSN